MKASNVPNETHSASTVVVSSENNHHFCRAASSRWITLSAAGDIEHFRDPVWIIARSDCHRITLTAQSRYTNHALSA